MFYAKADENESQSKAILDEFRAGWNLEPRAGFRHCSRDIHDNLSIIFDLMKRRDVVFNGIKHVLKNNLYYVTHTNFTFRRSDYTSDDEFDELKMEQYRLKCELSYLVEKRVDDMRIFSYVSLEQVRRSKL